MIDVSNIKKVYPEGCRVKLIKMNDMQAPPEGTCGTVRYVDSRGNVGVDWDNGSKLNFIPGVDVVKRIDIVNIKNNGVSFYEALNTLFCKYAKDIVGEVVNNGELDNADIAEFGKNFIKDVKRMSKARRDFE